MKSLKKNKFLGSEYYILIQRENKYFFFWPTWQILVLWKNKEEQNRVNACVFDASFHAIIGALLWTIHRTIGTEIKNIDSDVYIQFCDYIFFQIRLFFVYIQW